MDLHVRQQFDFLLHTSVERYVERLEQRNLGPDCALERLRTSPNGEGIWRDQFVDAIFQDFLLDNVAGACFVLQCLARQPSELAERGTIAELLNSMAKAAFATLLQQKTEESLEQRCATAAVAQGGQQ